VVATLHIQLLGAFRPHVADTPVTTLDYPRLQALLAYRALRRDTPQSRQHLAFLLWPDSAEVQARTNLRSLLHPLRRHCPTPTACCTPTLRSCSGVQTPLDARCRGLRTRAPPGRLIGREGELAELRQLPDAPECRLLTLLGPGGVGKTRLAIQAGLEHTGAFRDGVAFVALAPISAPELIVPAIADALKFAFYGPH
jgi:hypothetical protein